MLRQACSRHHAQVYHRMVARNRVWLAKRHLPALLVPLYLGGVGRPAPGAQSVAGRHEGMGGRVRGGSENAVRAMPADVMGPRCGT